MIEFNSKKNLFHLYTKNVSYCFRILPTKHLEHLYYGKSLNPIPDPETFTEHKPLEQGTSTLYSEASKLNLNTTLLELATYGKGDYREPTLHLETPDGYRSLDFLYEAHTLIKDHRFKNIPQADKEETLVVTLKEKTYDIRLKLYYTLDENTDCLIRNSAIINGENENLVLDKALSANFDFIESDYKLISLHGDWLRERKITTRKLQEGIIKLDSKRGTSSNTTNPFFALQSHQATDEAGDVYAFNLVYSGNFEANIEVSSQKLLRVNLGINSFDFRWKLAPNEIFITPEVISIYSNQGLRGMQTQMQNFVKTRIAKNTTIRPVVLNNWEATYFDFNEKKLKAIAKHAKKLGIECFVLDDGWFGNRDDDTQSLGDWHPHPKKFKKGLKPFSNYLKKQNLKFGLWVEPEMVNPQSELYKNHPEWAIKHPHIDPALGRHQLTLDLSNPDVCEYLYTTLSTLFKEANVDYVKWDMNRNVSDLYASHLPPDEQGKLMHKYYLGLYKLLENLTKNVPNILFESCASGGNRIDLGMHYYMPQAWTSDNTDAHERLSIQQGTLLAYPLNTVSNHVNDTVAHQTIRTHSMDHRFNVACMGILGYELDPRSLSKQDKKAIKNHIAYYKDHRLLLQNGTFYDLSINDSDTRFLVVNEEQTEAILGIYQGLLTPNPSPQPIKLKGLNPEKTYKVIQRPQKENLKRFGGLIKHALPIKLKPHGTWFNHLSNLYQLDIERFQSLESGNALMNKGLRLPYRFTGTGYDSTLRLMLDFSSRLYYLKEVHNGTDENIE